MIAKRVFFFILLCSFLLPFSSAGNLSANTTNFSITAEDVYSVTYEALPEKEWTFMVYLDGDNNLEAAAIDDLNEMEAAGGSTADVNIIVLIDLCSSENGADSMYGITWNEARIYYVEAGSDDEEIESTLISEEGEINMGDGETLTNFVDFVQTNYPAKKYGLSLWDHGGGLDGLCWDTDNNHNYLTINELQEALDGYHFDFLGMDACIMGQYEIVYEMRNCADYVGVSLLNEPNDGWDYENSLPYLLADPDMTGDVLGEHICRTYVDQYSSQATFSVWNTTDMADIHTEMEALSSILMDNLDTYGEDIGNARKLATSEGYPNYKSDLYEFVVNLKNSSSSEIVQQATETQAALEDINIMSYSNLAVNPFGLWIYFPIVPNEDYNKYYAQSNETHVDNLPNPYYGLDFVLNSSWEDFIYSWRESLTNALYTLSDDEQIFVTSSEDEYFAVDLVAGDKISVMLESDNERGPYIYLYNAMGQLVDSDETTSYSKEVNYLVTSNCSVFIGVIEQLAAPSFTYNLSVNINTKPYISDILTTPESPGFGEDVEFSCIVIDGHGLTSVILSYNTSSGWTDVSMIETEENKYSVSLSNSESLQCILYKISATDSLENTQVSATRELIFHETILPEVTDIKLNPKRPKSGEEVEISFNAHDSSGLKKIVFSYNLEGSWKNKSIYDVEQEQFSVILQIPEEGSVIQFKIYVFDIWENCYVTEITTVDLNVSSIDVSPLYIVLAIAFLSSTYLLSKKKGRKNRFNKN